MVRISGGRQWRECQSVAPRHISRIGRGVAAVEIQQPVGGCDVKTRSRKDKAEMFLAAAFLVPQLFLLRGVWADPLNPFPSPTNDAFLSVRCDRFDVLSSENILRHLNNSDQCTH